MKLIIIFNHCPKKGKATKRERLHYSYNFTATSVLSRVTWNMDNTPPVDYGEFILGNVYILGAGDVLGNASSTLVYSGDVVSYSDYSPYGTQLDQRHGQEGEKYRYGYQGSEKDDEIKGEGNSYTTEYRMLDPRIGRWLSIDPLAAKYPGMSPYTSMNNNPVTTNDVTGTEGTDWIKRAGSNHYEFDSQVQSQADATYRYGEGTSYLNAGGTFPGKNPNTGQSVGNVTVHDGGLMTWGSGKKANVSDNAVNFPIDEGYGLPNDKPSDWMAGARIPMGNRPSIGSEGKGAFYTDLSSPYLESWMNERAKSDAISKFVIGYGAVGIAAPFVVGGAIVSAPVWAPAVVQGARLVGQGAKFYHNTFGKTGGYANMGYNYYFQSSASGDWGIGSKDLFALGAQGFMKANTPIWQQSLVGASGALVQYTPNGGLTTMNDFSVGYNIGTAMNGALIPIVGNTKYANSLTSNFMFAGSQAVINGVENPK